MQTGSLFLLLLFYFTALPSNGQGVTGNSLNTNTLTCKDFNQLSEVQQLDVITKVLIENDYEILYNQYLLPKVVLGCFQQENTEKEVFKILSESIPIKGNSI
jgi:hypothetical protein